MDVDVEPHYFGMRLENGRFLNLTYCKKPRSKFICLGRTSESRSPDKRDMSIIEGEN
jgi:hypothetical protein